MRRRQHWLLVSGPNGDSYRSGDKFRCRFHALQDQKVCTAEPQAGTPSRSKVPTSSAQLYS